MSQAPSEERFHLKALLLLSLGHLVTDLSQGGLPVLLPFIKESFQLSYAAAGAVLMTSNLTSSIIQPLFGYFSDRWGASWLLPGGVLLSCLGFGVIGFAPNYAWLLLIVLVSGFGIAGYHPEGFKVARFFTGNRKVTGMAIFAVGGNLGLSLGPLLAIAGYTWIGLKGTVLFFVPGIITTVLLLASLGWLSEPQRAAALRRRGDSLEGPRPMGRRWVPLILLILAVTVRSLVHMGIIAFVPFYYLNVLHGDPVVVGQLVTVFLMAGAVGTILGAPLADRFGHKPFLLATLVVQGPLLWIFLQAQGLAVFLLIAAVGAVLVSSFSVTIVMAQQLLPDRLGMASGLMVGFAIGTGGIAAIVMGSVADVWGVLRVLQVTAMLPWLGALFAFLLPYPFVHEGVSQGEAAKTL